MSEFFEFLKIVVICITVFIIVFIILLSLPGSRLRNTMLKIYGYLLYISAAILTGYIISPVDGIPDFIPFLGQLDDAGAGITAILSALTGYASIRKARQKK